MSGGRKPDYAGGRQSSLFMPETKWTPPSQLPSLAGVKELIFDTETRDEQLEELGPGVRRDPKTNYVVGIAIGIENDGPRMYMPVRHEGGGNLDETIVKRWAKRELSNFKGKLTGAHLLYDLDWMGAPAWDVQFKNVTEYHDVQVAEPLIDEWRYSYALDAISHSYLGIGKEEEILRKAGAALGFKDGKEIKKNLWRLPAAYAGAYAEGDIDRPARILPLQFKKMEEEGLMGIYKIERKLIPILLGMRQRGCPIDKEQAIRVREQLLKRRDEQIRVMRSLAGPKAELNIPETFVKELDRRGLQYPTTEKLGKPSIKRPWLEAHQHDPLVFAIMDGRKCDKMVGTFIDGHIFTHSINNRIHCEFNQLKNEDGRGTIARFSSSNPNMQNVPARDGELAPLIRSMFIPEAGEDWQRDDYSQVEYRILVNYAVGPGAETARENYRNDPKTDYHKFVANMLGVDPEDKIKRKRVKNTNFAKGYGAQAPKLAETFGCSVQEAMEFIQEYEEKLPFTVRTFDEASKWAGRRGFVTTILGRRARFPLWEPIGAKGKGKQRPIAYLREKALEIYGPRIKRADTYKALNRKIQGSAADMMKKAMTDAYEAGVFAPGFLGWPLVTVHDELDCSVPRTPQGDEAGKELTRIMERATPLMCLDGKGPEIPVLVESDRGSDWGKCA